MGNYTQFVIHCQLKNETPCEIVKCLQDMVDGNDNDLFTYSRNPLVDYNQNENLEFPKSFDGMILKAHGNIKNYWHDIDRFVEFIRPHIEIGFLEDGSFAKSLYEEYDEWDFYKLLN